MHSELQLLKHLGSRPAEGERLRPLGGQSAGGVTDPSSKAEVTDFSLSLSCQMNVGKELKKAGEVSGKVVMNMIGRGCRI